MRTAAMDDYFFNEIKSHPLGVRFQVLGVSF